MEEYSQINNNIYKYIAQAESHLEIDVISHSKNN